jgi:predicted DNA-binding transcriptional regulator YafY
MSRAARLLALMQALRRHRRAATARELADELGVTIRTIYRDVATLQQEGAAIEGAAGFGYVLREDFFLPPLMFGADEIDALILGLRLVGARGDPALGAAASDALAKIAAVLPPPFLDAPATSGLLAGPAGSDGARHLPLLRHAIRAEAKLDLAYADAQGHASRRVVWPIAIGFFDRAEVLAAWCEGRGAFRHFRLDRIVAVAAIDARMPRRRRVLLAEWRATTGLGGGC